MAIAYTSAANIKTFMGVTDTNSDAAFTAVATAVNAMIEDYIGAPIGDGGTAVRTYDGDGGTMMLIRGGLQGITTLEVADGTGGTYTAMGTAEYKLRPLSYERPTGWPGWRIELTDLATTTFTAGYDTVRITPGTAWGFAATPPELSRIADIMGVRMFQSRQSGETLTVGTNDFGQAIVRFLPEPEYIAVLDHFAYSVGGKSRMG